jgi:hypothetical protein
MYYTGLPQEYLPSGINYGTKIVLASLDSVKKTITSEMLWLASYKYYISTGRLIKQLMKEMGGLQ